MTWELAIIAGALAGLGVTIIVAQFVTPQPHLSSVLHRLGDDSASRDRAPAETPGPAFPALLDRVGRLLERRVPSLVDFRLPRRELEVLRIPPYRYFGRKALWALVGLALPTVFSLALGLAGFGFSLTVPLWAGLVVAVIMWFLPDLDTRQRAAAARDEFARALGAYTELVALERAGGAGSTQALESAAEVGDSWVFQRLREELARARWAGVPPWSGLHALSEQLGVHDLDDLADIMRLSGEEGATVYDSLRARASGLRNAILSAEHTRANADSERMVIPVALLAMVFVGLLAAPMVMRML